MTCQKCKYEFCWTCKQNHIGHELNICAVNELTTYFFYTYLFLNLLFLINICGISFGLC